MNLPDEPMDADLTRSLSRLSQYLLYRYRKKPLIFLDDYDTPFQDAYIYGY